MELAQLGQGGQFRTADPGRQLGSRIADERCDAGFGWRRQYAASAGHRELKDDWLVP
jgi:hypothetical protein